MNNEKKRMLIISGTVPPDNSATADILGKIIPCVQKADWSIDCLTVKSRLKEPEITHFQGTTVYHANYLAYLPAISPSPMERITMLWRRIKYRKKSTVIPLYKEEMVSALLQEMERRGAGEYDALVAVCAYYAAAEAVKRFVSKHVYGGKTVLYQVDPLSTNAIYPQSQQNDLETYETEIHKTWTAVLTTPLIKKYWEEKGTVSPKIHAVEFPVIQKPVFEEAVKKKEDEIRCVFAGFLYPELRNPQYLLQLFSEMEDLKIHLYIFGTGMEDLLNEYAEGALKGRLFLKGQVSPEVCSSWLAGADVLINIGNAVNNQVPSKIFQYLNYGKPILNVYKQEDCPSLPYLKDYPLALNVLEKNPFDERDAKAAERWIKASFTQSIPFEQIYHNYHTCTPEYVSRVLLDCLQ